MGGIHTLVMASGMKVVKMGAGPCSFFRTVTSGIFVTVVVKSLADNARIVVWCPLLQRHERKRRGEGVGSTAAWTGVETETDGEDTWSAVHEGS